MKNQILKIFIIGYVICLTFCASQIQENTEFNEYSMIEAEKYFESTISDERSTSHKLAVSSLIFF